MNALIRTSQGSAIRGVLALVLAVVLVLPANAQRSNAEVEAPGLVDLANLAEASPTLAYNAATWDSFSGILVDAIREKNDHFRAAALRLVIQYSRDVTVDDAIFDLVRLYRDHPNERMRRMAVVAIASTGNTWGIDMLRRSVRFENSSAVKHTLVNVLAEIDAGVFGPALIR